MLLLLLICFAAFLPNSVRTVPFTSKCFITLKNYLCTTQPRIRGPIAQLNKIGRKITTIFWNGKIFMASPRLFHLKTNHRPLSVSRRVRLMSLYHFVILTSTSSASGFVQTLTICIIRNNIVQMKEPCGFAVSMANSVSEFQWLTPFLCFMFQWLRFLNACGVSWATPV